MPPSSQLLAAIEQSEGCKLIAYLDTVGVWTIGYGHTPATRGQVCTSSQAADWLQADIATAAKYAAALPEAKGLCAARTDALTELMFNLGPTKWRAFVRTRAAIADCDWQAAHDGLLASLWAKQVGPVRSGRIAGWLLTGSYSV